MNRTTMIFSAAVLVASAGCGRAVTEGVGIVVGPRGVYSPLEPLPPAGEEHFLGEYERFELGQFREDAAGRTPPALFALLPGEFAKQIERRDLPDVPDGKTLIVRGQVLHYEEADIFGHAFGPVEQVIARVELVDAETGRVLATAVCIGRNEETLISSVRIRAKGLAQAIATWISDHYQ